MEIDNNPKDIKIATSSEDRIASMLLDALEVYHKFMGVALGLEELQLEGTPERISNIITNRRCSALIKATNALGHVISIAKPNVAQVIDCSIEGNDVEELNAIKHYLNIILKKIDMAEISPTLKDDLIREIETGSPYSVKKYILTDNFWELVRELESYYDGVYSILLQNGLLTKLKSTEISRKRLNDL